MPPLTSIERDDLLATPGLLLRIATVDAAGNPQVTPIWFIYEDGRIWFTPRSESAWLEHIRTHPRIGAVIDETEIPYRKLVFEGDAEIVYDLGADDVWRDRYRRIAERYLSPKAAAAYISDTIDQPRALCAVTLADADTRGWRMPLGDEPHSGMWHRRYYGAGTKYGDESGRV